MTRNPFCIAVMYKKKLKTDITECFNVNQYNPINKNSFLFLNASVDIYILLNVQ